MESKSHFPDRNQLWKSLFNVSFSYDLGEVDLRVALRRHLPFRVHPAILRLDMARDRQGPVLKGAWVSGFGFPDLGEVDLRVALRRHLQG